MDHTSAKSCYGGVLRVTLVLGAAPKRSETVGNKMVRKETQIVCCNWAVECVRIKCWANFFQTLFSYLIIMFT